MFISNSINISNKSVGMLPVQKCIQMDILEAKTYLKKNKIINNDNFIIKITIG